MQEMNSHWLYGGALARPPHLCEYAGGSSGCVQTSSCRRAASGVLDTVTAVTVRDRSRTVTSCELQLEVHRDFLVILFCPLAVLEVSTVNRHLYDRDPSPHLLQCKLQGHPGPDLHCSILCDPPTYIMIMSGTI
jgi:hypothetical protein